MPETLVKSGHCLCAAVRFTATLTRPQVAACHCGMCRHWIGGPFIAVEAAADTVFEGREHIRTYDSSAWAERGFCATCGSALFYRLKSTGQYGLPVGLLDDTEGLHFAEEIYIDHKPPLYSFAEATHKMTQAEFEAQFASPA